MALGYKSLIFYNSTSITLLTFSDGPVLLITKPHKKKLLSNITPDLTSELTRVGWKMADQTKIIHEKVAPRQKGRSCHTGKVVWIQDKVWLELWNSKMITETYNHHLLNEEETRLKMRRCVLQALFVNSIGSKRSQIMRVKRRHLDFAWMKYLKIECFKVCCRSIECVRGLHRR